MTITKLIEALNAIRDRHGDLPCGGEGGTDHVKLIVCDDGGQPTLWATREAANSAGHAWQRVECRHIAWNSDGSPVEGIADRDYWRAKAMVLEADRDELRAEADSLRSRDRDLEVLHHQHGLAMVGKDVEIAKLKEELARMQPAVDAVRVVDLPDLIGTAAVKAMTGIEWANVHADYPDRAAQAILAALKGHGLVVVPTEEMLDAGAMKTCETCRWNGSRSVCGAKDCLGSVHDYRGWEPRHD